MNVVIFITDSQLPVVRLNPLTIVPKHLLNGKSNPQDQALCAFCEYLLHFIQQASLFYK